MAPPIHDAERLLARAGWVRRLALGLVGNAHDADDLIQDALVAALERDPTERSFGAWFGAVLRNLAWKRRRERVRRERREQLVSRREAGPAADEHLVRVSVHQRLVRAVMELDEPYRSVLVLRYLDELPPRAIARRLGLNVHTVRTRTQRGLEQLRRDLERRSEGREQWLASLLALYEAPAAHAGPVAGALLMSTKLKIAAAAALVALGIWTGFAVTGERRPPEEGNSALQPAGTALDSASAKSANARIETADPNERMAAGAGQQTSASLNVRVVALEARTPLEGITLAISGVEGAIVSDADGRAHFDLEPGRAYELAARSSTWRARDEKRDLEALRPGEVRALEIALVTEPDIGFFGRVVDAASDAPLADARVRIDDIESWTAAAGGWNPAGVSTTTSGLDGNFDLRIRSWKPGVVRVSREGYSEVFASASGIHPSALEPWIVRLEREAVLELVVVQAGAAPQSGLVARASAESTYLLTEAGPWNFRWRPDPFFEATTDSSGTARLVRLPARVPLDLRLARNDKTLFESTDIRLAPGETRRIEVSLAGAVNLHGIVRDSEHTPMAGIEIWAVKGVEGEPGQSRFLLPIEDAFAKTRTDAGGRFVLEGLPAGDWTVGPAPTRHFGSPAGADLVTGLAQPVKIEAGAQPDELEYVVWRGLYVRGRALGPKSEPVASASVFATGPAFFGLVLAITDRSGAFELGPLVPGTYSLQGRASGFGGYTNSAIVQAEAGSVDVRLLFEIGGSVSGRVLRPEGQPAKPFWIAFHPSSGPGLPSSWSSSEPHGPDFSREGLEPGTYTLIARTADGLVGVAGGIVVEGGHETRGVEIQVASGARLSVTAEGQAEVVIVELWSRSLFLGRHYLTPGEVWPELVPAGPITIQRVDAQGRKLQSEERVILSGESTAVTLR